MFQLLLTTCDLSSFQDAFLSEAEAELDRILGKPEVFQGCFIPTDEDSINAYATCLESRLQCGVEINPKLCAVKVWSAGSTVSEEVKHIISAVFGRRPAFAINLFGDEPT